jgi:Glycosyl hydrolase family 115/Gylcosyl hydrolase family 115 C-terminal domain
MVRCRLNLSAIALWIALMIAVCSMACQAQEMNSQPAVVETGAAGDFRLAEKQSAAPLYVDAPDHRVVHIAADALAADIERVTGIKPRVASGAPQSADYAVFIGTLGRSALIDNLVAAKKLDVAGMEGAWESFVIATVPNPLPGVKQGLVIAGSDRRGTAYGVFTLSEAIGVSPWYWWADVPTRRRTALFVRSGVHRQGPPAVKYRGIFINDEDWGLEPWASKTFEPETGDIGPKTYAKVFELLLRLRANLVWPGMHESTIPFHQVPGNAATADKYAIIVGSSHAEPMLRNNVGEWKAPKEHFNYLTHRDEVLSYWEERVKERTSGESLFTIGMRGIHDSPIVGPKTQAERIATVEKVFADQRNLLARYLGNGDPTKVGQVFIPYKEVLDDYNAGLKVPEDVPIIWPDDNFGYIRRFATPAERARPGGLGVYYHASYLGAPLSWLWIDTLPPALVWSEMTRAYEQGSRTLWIVNVGDIKNAERSTEFFLNLAWHADRTDLHASARFLRETAARDFGPAFATDVVDILNRLQAINFARKTEHLQWHLPLTPYKPTELNEAEIDQRLKACADLLRDTEALANRLPAEARDAYFQLVGYPVAITAAANERYFRSELARADVARGRSPEANLAAASDAERRIVWLTERYNNDISGGKWRNIVTVNGVSPKDWRRFQRDTTTPRPAPAQGTVAPPAPPASEPLSRPSGARSGDFVERDKVVSIHAGHFTGQTDLPSGAGWRSVPGLGRTGSAVTVLPSTAAISPGAAPSLSYRFHVATSGSATLHVRLLPTHPLVTGQGLRLAVAIDDGEALPLAVTSGFDPKSSQWNRRVLANATETSLELPKPLAPGWHTLRLVAVDAGVVVDKIVLDLGGLRPSYDGPAETRLP